MSLTVHTARINYRGHDRLDVTRKSGKEGIFLAPSWRLLGPALRARRALELSEAGLQTIAFELDVLEREWSEAWESYTRGYFDEMRASYRARRAEWDALLARERVTLCCFCNDPQRCHRTLLARDILPKLGATYAGEL